MSKGLEALKNILNQELIKPNKYRKTIGDIASVGQVITIQKELKALEIIKEKRVNCYLIINSENLKDYNECVDDTTEKRLTQEEYDLLKEVVL